MTTFTAVSYVPYPIGAQVSNTSTNLGGGLLYTYVAGTTSTSMITYQDSTGSSSAQNTNPIVLDAHGRLTNEIWIPRGQAVKLVLKDSSNNTLDTKDFVPGIQYVPSGGGGPASGSWLNVINYGADPTNTSDSTTAWQLALNAQESSGSPIYAPSGKYKINGQLTYNAPLVIFGDGPWSTYLYCNYTGGPSFIAGSGTTFDGRGTILQDFSALGPGNTTGTGEVFYQAQLPYPNENAIFRDLYISNYNLAGISISDSFDCVFEDLRLFNIGDLSTTGWGILHTLYPRAAGGGFGGWTVANGSSTTGNKFINVSVQNILIGIGTASTPISGGTTGTQMQTSQFYRVTGQGCGWTIQTYAGTVPANGWFGNNLFLGVYSETNITGGIQTINGSEIECYKASYGGGGNNQSSFLTKQVILNQGRMYLADGGNGTPSNGTPTLTYLNASGGNGILLIYSIANSAWDVVAGSNSTSILQCIDGGPLSSRSYVRVQDSTSAQTATLNFGAGNQGVIDYGVATSGQFTITSVAGLTLSSAVGDTNMTPSTGNVVINNTATAMGNNATLKLKTNVTTTGRILGLSNNGNGSFMSVFDYTNNASIVQFYSTNAASNAGNVAFTGGISVNGVTTAPAQSTGWGTPTNASVQNNFAGSSATLAQTGAAVAELLVIMKALGFIGA